LVHCYELFANNQQPDAFELCLSLDVPDTYFNLKTLFDLKMEEFEFYFDLETPPYVCLLDSEAKTSADSSEETSLAAIWPNKEYVDRAMDDTAPTL
jgi:hypothetical protein